MASTGDDTIQGGPGSEEILAEAGNDIVSAGDGNDTVDSGPGDDTVSGEAGNDTLVIAEDHDSDMLDGGEGAGDQDTLWFGNTLSSDGVSVTFSGNEAGSYGYDNAGASGTFQNIEAVVLTGNADQLDAAAATAPVAADGGGGDDTIIGGGGADTLDGGAGNDAIDGGQGADSIAGGTGDDTIHAGPDYAAFPELTLLEGAGQTVAGTNGNADFDHSVTSDGTGVDSATVTIDGGWPLTGYQLGDGTDANEVHTHSFTQEVAGAELSLVEIDPGEQVVIWLDGVALNLNDALAAGIVSFDPGTTGFVIDGTGALTATGAPVAEPVPAVILINIPFTTLGVQNLSEDGTGGGSVYAVAVDSNPPSIYDGEQDTVDGGSGNDYIAGGDGDDALIGGTGNDTLDGGRGENLVQGGDDRDEITATGGDTIDGGEGGSDYDTLVVNDVASVAYGGGNDETGTVTFNDGSVLEFQNIERLIVDGVSTDPADGIVDGTGGDDVIGAGYADGQGDALDGSDGDNDTIDAGAGNDSVLAGAGDDLVFGGAGDDTLVSGGAGGPANDSLFGGAGNDRIVVVSDAGFLQIDGGDAAGEIDTLALTDPGTGGVNVNYTGDAAGSFGFLAGSGGGNFAGIDVLQTTEAGDFVNASASTSGETITTLGGNDFVTGSAGADLIDVGADNDEVFAGGGNDTVGGGEGADNLYGGEGDDSLTGDAGDDYMQGDTGNDTVAAGEGDDFLRGDAGNDAVYGGLGNDSVYGGADADSVFGGDGQDEIYGGFGVDTVYGGLGDDTMTGSGGDDLVHGDEGNDFIHGSDGADTIHGGDGADTMLGEEDADTFYGGAGDYVDGYETVTTGTDDDSLHVTDVAQVVWDELNPENGTILFTDGGQLTFYGIEHVFVDGVEVHAPDGVVSGGAGDDTIDAGYLGDPEGDLVDAGDASAPGAGPDDDVIAAGAGNDLVDAGAGDDLVYGGLGDDTAAGGTGNDSLLGEGGDDSLSGGQGDDTLSGGDQFDLLLGGAGNDSLLGGDGNDTLAGDAGADTLAAEGGDDRIVLADGWGDDSASGGESAELDGDLLDAGTVTADLVLNLTDPESGTLGDGANTLDFAEIERVQLGGGDDSVTGSSGDDVVATGAGADTVDGGAGNDFFNLGAGDGADDLVLLRDGGGADIVSAFEGPIDNGDGTFTGQDLLDVSELTDAGGLPVTAGDVTVTDSNGDGSGHAVLTFPDGTSLELQGVAVPAGDPSAWLVALGIPPALPEPDFVVEGTAGDDLIGTAYLGDPEGDRVDGADNAAGDNADLIDAQAGNDTVKAGEGDDTVDGGTGNDSLDGGTGGDVLDGGADDDIVQGGQGDDSLSGGIGNDLVLGDAGNDSLGGGEGADTLQGGDDRDTFLGGVGDSIDGGEGGDDHDTLDLRGYTAGSVNVLYDGSNPENGTVEFLDGSGAVVGTLTFENIEHVIVPCFTPGARIATALGEVRVESLREGDRVMTRDHGYQPIRWVGRRRLTGAELAAQPRFQPVRIGRGALGLNLPERDLVVSPQHRMLLGGSRAELLFGEHEVLVAAAHMEGRGGVSREAVEEVIYIHLLFDRHEIIRANGAWTESYQPGELTLNGMEDGPRDELLALFPELKLGLMFPAARLSLKRREAQALFLA